jgi:hypothetical protein
MNSGTFPYSACCQETFPRDRGGLALGSSQVDVLGSDPEDGRERAAGVAENFGPEVGDPLPGAAGGEPPIPGHEVRGGNADVPTDSFPSFPGRRFRDVAMFSMSTSRFSVPCLCRVETDAVIATDRVGANGPDAGPQPARLNLEGRNRVNQGTSATTRRPMHTTTRNGIMARADFSMVVSSTAQQT